MRCPACGHQQVSARFCGRCGALSTCQEPDGPDRSADVDAAEVVDAEVVGGSAAERGEGPARRDAGPWPRLAAVIGLVVVLGAIAVLAEGEPDDPAATPPAGSAGPVDPTPAEDGSGPAEPDEGTANVREAEEARAEDGSGGDAPVVPLATAELPEDTYCWWDGVDAAKCDVWAVKAGRRTISQVVAAGERVIVVVGDAVVALDGSDGAVSWTWRHEWPGRVNATADRVFVTGRGGRTVALDAATGSQMWGAELREDGWLRQSVRDGVVVNREPSSMTMFAADDGTLLREWAVQPAGADPTPIIADEVVMTVAGQDLVAYSRVDGHDLWRTPLTPTLPPVHWPGTDVVIVAEDSRVSAVEIATGDQLWTRPAEGVEHLADVGAGTVAVAAADRVDLVDRHTGVTVTPVHAPGVQAIQAIGDGRFLSRVGGAGVKLWQTEPLGTTWNLDVRMPRFAAYATIDPGTGETYVVAPITNGTTVVAFRVSDRDPADRRSTPACDGAQRSWHLDWLTAWAGEVVHAAVVGRLEQRRLFIRVPSRDPAATTFTVSARPLDTTGQARFSHFSEDWQEELTIASAVAATERFPPHWVVAAEFPHPGCWELRITGDQVDDTVILPVPAADEAAG